jgi:hypothetical protein
MRNYLWRVLVAFDQFINAVLGGHDDETISARVGRAALRGAWWGILGARVLDWIQPRHVEAAIANDDRRAELVDRVEDRALGQKGD